MALPSCHCPATAPSPGHPCLKHMLMDTNDSAYSLISRRDTHEGEAGIPRLSQQLYCKAHYSLPGGGRGLLCYSKNAELCTLWKPKDRSPPWPSRPEVGHPGSSCTGTHCPGVRAGGSGMAPMSTVSFSSRRGRPQGEGCDSFLVQRDLGFPSPLMAWTVCSLPVWQKCTRLAVSGGGAVPGEACFYLLREGCGFETHGKCSAPAGRLGPGVLRELEAQGLAHFTGHQLWDPGGVSLSLSWGLSFLSFTSGRLEKTSGQHEH